MRALHQCFKQIPPLLDPQNSSTFLNIQCNTEICLCLPNRAWGYSSICEYYYSYADSSYSRGNLSYETFTFDSTDGQVVSIRNVVSGCGHNNDAESFDDNHSSGIVGLGRAPFSLISQLGNTSEKKFSYCLVPHNEASSASLLKIRADAEISVRDFVSTPMFAGPCSQLLPLIA